MGQLLTIIFGKTIESWIAILIGLGTIGGVCWRYGFKFAIKKYKMYKEHQILVNKLIAQIPVLESTLNKIHAQLIPNGGSSLCDSVNRIENLQIYSDQKQKAIINSLAVGYWISNKDGECTEVGLALCLITDRIEAQMLGNNWINCVYIKDKERVFDQWQLAIEQGTNFKEEYYMVRNDGHYQRVTGTAYMLTDKKGEVAGYFGTLNKIGEPISKAELQY